MNGPDHANRLPGLLLSALLSLSRLLSYSHCRTFLNGNGIKFIVIMSYDGNTWISFLPNLSIMQSFKISAPSHPFQRSSLPEPSDLDLGEESH
jgi:hypothetical protein